MLGFGDLHTKMDHKTGLYAIIAIHNTSRGPALGGCRFYPYKTSGLALKDALQLAHMMTLKAAINELPHGGGKSVIVQPKKVNDREALFRSFGDFVHEQNGRYITAIDVGTSTAEMDIIATRTPYVIGAATVHAGHGDPATHTALGVLRGIEAAVLFKYDKDNLQNIHVAIQGAGHVGYALCALLHERGAHISICDPNEKQVMRCVENFNANAVSVDDIYHTECDVFAPCALGGCLTLDSINRLRCKIIAGSANNQLAHIKYGAIIKNKDILFAPDFLINAGGLINAALVYDTNDPELARAHTMRIYDKCLELFERAAKNNAPTNVIAQQLAIERIG